MTRVSVYYRKVFNAVTTHELTLEDVGRLHCLAPESERRTRIDERSPARRDEVRTHLTGLRGAGVAPPVGSRGFGTNFFS